ncbi:LysM peptidoglycan-binding domain-containing protein [Coprobacillus sp. AF15-30]|nr:LysM peptidoglycan-binding domain-containing protein [Coprobacillus sp. AF15-30]
MKAGLNKIKIAIISMIVLAMAIGQLELFGKVYAEELEKIKEQDPYGEYYDENINNVHKTSAQIIEKGNPDVITKEPSVDEEDTSRQNDQEIIKLRTENTKTYKLSSGEYVTDFYFEQIHKKEDGKYVEIDNDIEKKTSLFRSTPSYENKDGLYDINIQKGVLEITDPKDNVLTVMPSGSLTNYAIKENVILYSEVEKNLDLEYRINSNTVSQNIYINGELDKDTYSFEVYKDDYNVSKNDAGSIVFKKDKKEVFVLNAPYLVDKDGNRNQEVGYDYKELDNGNIKVTLSLTTSWLSEEDRVYPVVARSNVAVENVDVIDLESSYIRSGRPNIQSQYSDLFVGYDDNFYGGKNSNIKIARTFIYFAMPNIGENQRVENAVLKLYKEQDLDRANELNDINIYNSSYVDPGKVTWNTQPADNQKQFISNTKFSKPKGFKEFDITKHVQELKDGQKKTLILQVTDESPNWKCNVFNSESTGNLPKVEIYHCDDFDVDPNLDINEFDNELRVYSKDGQYFEAISMDGIAKPNSDIDFDLYAKTNETDFELVKSQQAKEKSSPYFIDPVYITDPIDGTQKYEKGEVNYTTSYLKIGDIPKYDTFYEYRMKVKKDGTESEKELITDGFIIYKVKLGDNLKSIASHYGLKVDDIKKDNNTSTNKVKEGDVLFLRFAKDNPKVPKDVYRPPLKLSSFEAKYVYRGPACYGNCAVADPVNTSIGNFYHESKDFTLTDFDELSLTRVYNSYGEDNASIFGNNYSSNIEQYISYDKDDNMIFYRGDGKILKIEKKDGKYVPKLIDRLTVNVDGDYVSIKDDKEDVTYIFDEYGILTSIKTKTGFESRINYDEYGFITNIDMGNKQVTFEYNDYHLVSKINLPNGTNVQYQYNADRQLTVFIDANGNSEQYSYDKNGKVKSITDKNGNTLAQNTYKDNGVVVSQTDANGNKVSFDYKGNTTSVTYNDKETEKYVLDDSYKVTKITKADGSSKSYSYNDAGNMIGETDEKGQKTTYEYNKKGYLTLQSNPDGTSEKYTYDENDNVTSKTSADGTKETYKYDSNSNLIYENSEDRKGVTYEYNEQNLLVKETDALGVWKSYAYDGNQVVTVTHSNGLVENYSYDAMGNIVNESDSNGRTTTYVYDNRNQIIKKTDSYGNSEEYKYDGNGNVVEYIDKLGSKTVTVYDKNNNAIQTQKGNLKTSKKYDNRDRIISETDEQGLTKKYTYDAKGQIVKETDAYGQVTTHTYDAVGHEIKTVDGKGNTTSNEYDGDNLVKTTDARGNVTSYEYDEFNRIVKTTLPNGKTETKEYDKNGNIIKTVDQRGLANTKEYDIFDRVIKEVNEQGVAISNKYDVYGQLIKKTEDKKTTTYSYDVYGNTLSETDTYGNTKTSEYDKLDRLVKETDELGNVTQHKYDAMDNETETIDAKGNSERKIYDINSILVQDIDKLGNITTYKYNDKGQQVETVDAYKNTTKFEYDKFGNVTKTTINDTPVEIKSYDEYGRVTKTNKISEVTVEEYDSFDQVIKSTNQTTGLVTETEYDKNGNVTKTSDNGGKVTTHEYDDFSQEVSPTDPYGRVSSKTYDKYGRVVKEVSNTNEATDYEYDKYGNVVKTTNHLGSVTDSTYDLLNRKVSDSTDGKKTLTYSYDAKGQLVSTHDSFTDKTDTVKYDALGQAVEKTDKLGNVTKTDYDAKGQVIKETDAAGNATLKEYDIYGNVIKETDALGNSSQTHYNAFGLVEKEVDKRGFAVSYVYNDKFQLTEMTDKLGNKATFEYNDQGFVSKATNQNGFVSEYEYDIYGQKTKETDPNKNVTENEYDLLGQVVKTVEPRKTTVNKYDSLGRIVSVKENDKTTKENEYNDLNQIVKSTNALKYVSTYEYDKYGNKTKETYEEHETVNKYDVNSQLIKKTENKDKVTTYSYDALGREVSQKQNDKEIISKKYDAVSNVVEKTEKGLTTQYRYDALKHPVQYLYPSLEDGSMKAIVSVDYDEEGNAVQYKDIYDHVIKREYDANSNMIAETNSNGFITRYQYDSLNNMTKVQSPLERVMKYDYDGNNNLVERSYNDKKATYEYDEADNLIKEVSEYGLTETYQYDDFGQMTSYTKNDGTTIDYSYDALGRKLSEGTRQFKYDAYDNLLEADYNNKSVKYTYDKFNNITKVKDANDNNVEYKWDIYGNRTEIKYNDYTIGYTYSQFDKIDKVSKNGKEYASYSYDVRGNTKSLERNGITTDYSYDELNRRTAYVNTKGDKMLSEYKYEYDGQDNVISETINGVVNSYDYNESDELKASTKTIDGKTVITEYSYDLFGNKVESSSDGTNKIYRYNDKNQLTSIKSKDGLTDIYYDKNGNVRDIYYAGGYKEYYQYDEFGQLTALKTNRDRTYNYEYDGEGDRIHEEKIINSPYDLDYKQDTEEWFDYMQSLPFTEVEELLDAKKSDESFDAMRYQLTYRRKNGLCASNLIKDPKSNEKCEYKDYLLDKTAENTLVLSENDDVHIYGEERISTESADGTQTYLSGNNQSVMAEISSKGTMSQIEYDDFGKTDDKISGYGYDGEKLDTTGNIYLRARYYNPRIGQFVQIDDYKGTQDNITSQNLYTYCLNNQYKYVDPSGHFGITTMVVLGILSYTGIGLLGIGLAANEKRKREEKEKAIKVANKNSKKKKKDDNNHNLNPTPSKGKGATSSVTNGIKKTVSETRKIVNKTVKQTAKTIQKKIPEPCPNDKVVSDSIEKYCNKLKKDYYGKYKDKGTQKAISSTIEQLRNEAYKENKVSWIKNKYEEYRDRIKIPPYKSDIGVSYLGGRYISLNGSKTSDAFVSKFNDFGNGYTFTMNTTEFVGKGSIKTITVVEFGAQLPSIDLKTGSFDHKIKCQLVFYEITYSIMVNSFTKLDLGIVTGIGIEFGWSYDSVENVFEIVNIADLGIGLLFRINIFINKLLAC